jgi:hypothetical protein
LALTKVTEDIRTLGTGEVIATNLATDAVTTTKILDANVTIAKISGSAAAAADTFLKKDGTWSAVASGIEWQAVQTTGFTAVAEKGYPCNTTAGTIAVTLPAGSVGDKIAILDYAGTAASNNISITANGTEKIKGVASDTFFISGNRVGVSLVYIDATQGWITVTAANEGTEALANTANAEVEYLVVGGGGGGGTGADGAGYGRGGGGAGGYRTNFGGTKITFVIGTTYTATVGTGSAGNTNGLDSVLGGSDITDITSTGGGSGTNRAGVAGGSGGAGSESTGGGAGNTPSTSPSQGNAGGSGGVQGSGGGGGATAVGVSVTGAGDGGAGGAGTANAITGASVTYAGGGGGGAASVAAAGGAGGGGAGFNYTGTVPATQGTDGLGGGGGGGSCGSCGSPSGGHGGDGIVILRMLTSVYTGVYTGSPTVTPDGSYTVIKFTGTGTYTQ